MICPKCGEVNSSNFLFCGMCGTILEPARRATAPVSPPPSRAAETLPAQNVPPRPAAATMSPPAKGSSPASGVAAPISGPSILGLDQGNVDVLRERAFSGLSSYAQPEPRSGRKEVLLTLLLLVALGAAGWWTYKNYIGVTSIQKSAAEATPPALSAANTRTMPPAPKQDDKAIEKNAGSEAAAPLPNQPAKANPSPETGAQATDKSAPESQSPLKPATPPPTQARHEVSAERIPAKAVPPVADSGDALFRRGEAYLYGRGGAEDCGNAIKFLKMASDKQHAKARSAMGTMYATGHCVPRDLPNAYRWFALALRVDPNNAIVEKNLSAVWSQMTPPERQLATKSQ